MAAAGGALAKDAGPALRIPLEPLGYQPATTDFLQSGGSMMTVHFVDEGHLLLTFAVRRLMKREADDPPDDEDRVIGAFLVELPTGKVLAKTEWRLHDRGQYLWELGHGRFLLRIRDRLTMIAPRADAAPGEAFREYPFLNVQRRIVAILLSAEDDLLTIETASAKPEIVAVRLGEGAPPPERPTVQINFYRMTSTGPAPDQLIVAAAGVLRSNAAIALPVTTRGFLDTLQGGRDRWLFNFDPHQGKVSELAEFDTTCFPRATFVTRGEFVAFGCRGAPDKQDIAGFNLKGEAMWQQNFFDVQLPPAFSFAPAAGRFALERTLVGSLDSGTYGMAGNLTGQEVRVYQAYNGKVLFRTDCTPIVRAGQNVALSPEGLQLAVMREKVEQHAATKYDDAYTVRTGSVEIYALPPLSPKDAEQVKLAQSWAPEDAGVRIDTSLQRLGGSDAAKASAQAAARADLAQVPVQEPVAASDPPQDAGGGTTAAGDADGTAQTPRKPPTLYGPGEGPTTKPQ